MRSLKKLGFFCAFIIPSLVLLGTHLGGWGYFLTPFFVFGLIPVLDWAVGRDGDNVPEAEVPAVAAEAYYRLILYSWVFVQYGMVIWGAWVVSSRSLTVTEWVGFILSLMTVTGGIGITVAHELGHKKSAAERFAAKAILLPVCYMHFYIEHNRGHHVHVATHQDPATSRRGETFYAFWLRSVGIGWLHAWQLEKDRLERRGLPVWSHHNEMLRFTLLPLLFAALLTVGFSLWADRFVWEVPVFFFAQAIMAFTLLEGVNYIEHYGIIRREVGPGRYERVNPLHSWNANQLLSNFFLFQLQRHSDHHAAAARPYQVLRHLDESPQLPTGYPAMLLLAVVPPLWFRVMDRRLDDWRRTQAATAVG